MLEQEFKLKLILGQTHGPTLSPHVEWKSSLIFIQKSSLDFASGNLLSWQVLEEIFAFEVFSPPGAEFRVLPIFPDEMSDEMSDVRCQMAVRWFTLLAFT